MLVFVLEFKSLVAGFGRGKVSLSCLLGSFPNSVCLRQLLAQKKQMEQQPASDVADTLPFDPVPVAAALMTGSSPDAVSSSDSQDSIGTPSGICRCLAGDFSNAKRGRG